MPLMNPGRGTSLDGMEKRGQPRIDERLVVTIQGRDKSGQPFAQDAVASSISESGALLSGITRHVRPGDLLWVDHAGKRSRFKVVWVRDSESHQLVQAAVHRLETEPCPWSRV
jgi:hypothetical protein